MSDSSDDYETGTHSGREFAKQEGRVSSNDMTSPSLREILLKLWHEGYNNGAYNARRTTKQVVFGDENNPYIKKTEEYIASIVPEKRIKTTQETYKDYDFNNPRHRYVTGVDVGWNQAVDLMNKRIGK